MSKTGKTRKTKASPKTTVLVRMPNDLVELLNQEVDRLLSLDPAFKTNRSEVIRSIIADYFAARSAKRE